MAVHAQRVLAQDEFNPQRAGFPSPAIVVTKDGDVVDGNHTIRAVKRVKLGSYMFFVLDVNWEGATPEMQARITDLGHFDHRRQNRSKLG